MKTPTERARGLLKYSQAPRDFVAIFRLPLGGFFPLVHTFGMQFPIDIVFCDASKKVLFLRRQTFPARLICPWKYFFGGIRYLLEFSGADLKSVEIGDQLEWSETNAKEKKG